MKRTLIVVLLCFAAVAVSASYKIYLVSGETVMADAKPVVQDGTATFSWSGLTYTMAASKIDFEKSEKVALSEAKAPEVQRFTTSTPVTTKPRKVDDENIEEIRKRARLANEEELQPPPEPYLPAEGEEGAEAGGGEAPGPAKEEGQDAAAANKERAQVQQRLTGLEQRLAQAEDNRNQIRSNIQSLRERYDSAIVQEEKTSLASQIESAQRDLTDASARVTDVASQVQATRSELNSLPIVVELPKTQ